MRGMLFLMVLATVPGWPAVAQEVPETELFTGFSAARVDVGSGQGFYGWQSGIAMNLDSHLGVVADFGGQYKTNFGVFNTDLSLHEFLFGLRYNARGGPATGFVHGLIGAARFEAGGASTSGFMMGLGGGLDYSFGDEFGIRLVQLDWLPNRFSGSWSSREVRASIGFLFKFGRM